MSGFVLENRSGVTAVHNVLIFKPILLTIHLFPKHWAGFGSLTGSKNINTAGPIPFFTLIQNSRNPFDHETLITSSIL